MKKVRPDRRKIRSIATGVRKLCERWNQIRHEFPPDLECMCAIASYSLWKSLKLNGVSSAKLVDFNTHSWGGHCWVEVGDYVYDITATQFGGERVTVCKKDVYYKFISRQFSVHLKTVYKTARVVKDLKSFKEWPDDQRPLPRFKNKFLIIK